MADILEIDVSALSSDADTLTQLLSQGTSECEALRESIDALKATWSGPAHDVFYEQVNNDLMLLEQVLSALQTYKEHMSYAVKEYTQCEQDVREMVAAIQI